MVGLGAGVCHRVQVDALTRAMHVSAADSLVIWYDAVNMDGTLGWQRQLNDLNRAFFDVSGAMRSSRGCCCRSFSSCSCSCCVDDVFVCF